MMFILVNTVEMLLSLYKKKTIVHAFDSLIKVVRTPFCFINCYCVYFIYEFFFQMYINFSYK